MRPWTLRCHRSPSRPSSARRRLGFERLEGRIDPATLIVSPMAPDGTQHSLRQVLASLDSSDTNTILLTPGTLHLASELDITGMNNLTIQAFHGSVTLDGAGHGRVLNIVSSNVTLSGLTITGGRADFGGGLRAIESTVTIDASTVTGNSVNDPSGFLIGYGGGVAVNGGRLTITASTISNNVADNGGGVYSSNGSNVLIAAGSTLSGNQTVRGYGGGIYAGPGSTVIVDAATIAENFANFDGGGIYAVARETAVMAYRETAVTVHASAIVRNTGGSSGGGIAADNGAHVTVEELTVSGNAAHSGGGGIYAINHILVGGSPSPVVTVVASTIAGNTAPEGGGIRADHAVVAVSDGSHVDGNTATFGGGGGMRASASTVTLQSGSTIAGNTAVYGGGIAVDGGRLTIDATTIADNNATTLGARLVQSQCGGGIVALSSAQVLVCNGSEITRNTAGRFGGGIYAASAAAVTVQSSALSENSAGIDGSSLYVGPSTLPATIELIDTTVNGEAKPNGFYTVL